MDAALAAVALLTTPLPTEDAALDAALAQEQPRVEARLAATNVAALPQATDPKALALLRLMDCVIVGGYSTGQVRPAAACVQLRKGAEYARLYAAVCLLFVTRKSELVHSVG